MTPDERIEIERCALFGLIRGADLRAQLDQLSVELFEHAPHRSLFLGVAQLVEDGEPVNDATVYRAAGGGRSVQCALQAIVDPDTLRVPWPARHIPALRELAAKRMLARAGSNGITGEDLRAVYARAGELLDRAPEPAPAAVAVDLADVEAIRPPMAVDDFIRETGIHVLFARSNVGKSWLKHEIAAEMLRAGQGDTRETLFEHPELVIRRGWHGVLSIGTEESATTESWRWSWTVRGLGLRPGALRGLRFRWGLTEPAVTIEQLEQLVIAERKAGPVDAVFFDSLTALLPASLDGQPVEWESGMANPAVRRLCARLRRVCEDLTPLAVFLIHHEGKDRDKGSRGPSEWLNSPDVVLKLERAQEQDVLLLTVEKQRDGIIRKPFRLERRFEERSVRHWYQGDQTIEASLSPAAQRADAFLAAKGEASLAEIEKGAKLPRRTAYRAAEQCLEAGIWTDTDRRTDKGSRIFARVSEG